MSLDEQFDSAAARAKQLPNQSNEILLQLYALFKQGREGDVSGDRPGGFDFKGQAKYDAWARLAGMSKDEARQAYIKRVDELAG